MPTGVGVAERPRPGRRAAGAARVGVGDLAGRPSRWSRTSRGPASSSMKASRSAGWARSSGRYAAPALSTASTAATMSAERGTATPDDVLRRRPRARRSRRASRFGPRVELRVGDACAAPSTTATASGFAATLRANSSGSVSSGTVAVGGVEACQHLRAAPPRSSRSTSDSGAVRVGDHRGQQRSQPVGRARPTVAASNRSVAYSSRQSSPPARRRARRS